jgi:hypothetical protein
MLTCRPLLPTRAFVTQTTCTSVWLAHGGCSASTVYLIASRQQSTDGNCDVAMQGKFAAASIFACLFNPAQYGLFRYLTRVNCLDYKVSASSALSWVLRVHVSRRRFRYLMHLRFSETHSVWKDRCLAQVFCDTCTISMSAELLLEAGKAVASYVSKEQDSNKLVGKVAKLLSSAVERILKEVAVMLKTSLSEAFTKDKLDGAINLASTISELWADYNRNPDGSG